MKKFVIYGLRYPDRPICYVGVTGDLKRRLKEHRARLGRAINAEVLETGIGTRIERAVLEHRWIAHFRAAGHKLYNLTEGGDGAETLSAEMRAHLSQINRGRIVSKETRKKMSASLKGKAKTYTPESLERAKETRIKPGSVPWNKFTPDMTDEQKEQIRQRILAAQTSESRAKMSEASLRGNAEFWGNLSEGQRAEHGKRISEILRKSGALKAAGAARAGEVSSQMRSWWKSMTAEERREFIDKRTRKRYPK